MRPLFLVLPLTACVGLQPTSPTDKSGDTAAVIDSGVSAGSLSADQSTLDFGGVDVYTTSDIALTLSNTGGEQLRVAAVLDGDGGFTLSDTTVALPGSEDAVLTVSFAPTFTGDYGATLTLSPTDGGDALTIPVTGVGTEAGSNGGGNGGDSGGTNGGTNGGDNGGTNGGDNGGDVYGAISLTPTTYDYGALDLGDSAYTSITVRNTGTGDLDIDSVTSSDSSFRVTGGTLVTPAVLAAGVSKTVQVTFTPTAERHYASTLSIASNDPDHGTSTVDLTGDGADLCDICAPLITVDTGGDPYSVTNFISLGGSADTRTWTISNDGDEDLVVSDVYVNNDAFAPCGEFTVGAWVRTTLAPRASADFNITYRASGTCLEVPNPSFDMNVLHILSNDPSQSDYVVELGGGGL